MDEVRMVRDRYPEPAPPTAREIARAKALLDDPPRRSRPRLRWGLGGVVVAAAAATVAIALVEAGCSDDDVLVTHTGCLLPCNHAPVVVVHPDDAWFGGVTPDVGRRLVAALLGDGAAALAARRLPRPPGRVP